MLVALMGKSGVGKTEVAKYLIERGYSPCKTGTICRKISNLLFGNDWKINTQRISDALIELEPSIFLKAAMRSRDHSLPTVIDSLRYKTDLDAARAEGFTVIKVIASDDDRKRWLKDRGETFTFDQDALHQTEVELDSEDADVVIENRGNIEDLRRKVDAALTAL